MADPYERPEISVLMPAYNAARYLLRSVESVLAQTHENFELLVIDDGSSDCTQEIVGAIRDPRLRILRNPENLGIVGSLNRGMTAARGRYIARIDADDLCHPIRFARQVAFLDASPHAVLVGTEMSVLENGEIGFRRQRADADPVVLRWMLHVANPVGHPSVMFRAEAVGRLGTYLREPYRYAEDFDFLHRLLPLGQIAVLPEYLVTYRVHTSNATRTHRPEMIASTAAVLRDAYATLLGADHGAEATLMAEHLIACRPLGDAAALDRLGDFLNTLTERFSEAYGLEAEQRRRVHLHTGRLWWRLIQASIGAGYVTTSLRHAGAYRWSSATRPAWPALLRPAVAAVLRRRPRRASAPLPASPARPCMINAARFEPAPIAREEPPVLHVVVDTEAEFDWSKGFDRSLTSVSAMAEQYRAQAIFDAFGARPIYVMDYAVATQPEGYEPLRTIFTERRCAIGAHLHPWINPPFEEEVSDYNSFAGNLPADLEARKLSRLVAAIQANFGVAPMFFKAGRYGLGPATMDALARLGFEVDFSILPLADLRHRGGPDFRAVDARPYRVGPNRLLSLPMSRGQIGLLAPLPLGLHSLVRSPLATRLRLPGILSRAHLANTVTLTPEGVSAAEQIRLIQSMVARGYRSFTLHYHSPSLARLTPYVTSEAELAGFLGRLEAVCRFFFETLGGLPGNPADLLPVERREALWPMRADTGVVRN